MYMHICMYLFQVYKRNREYRLVESSDEEAQTESMTIKPKQSNKDNKKKKKKEKKSKKSTKQSSSNEDDEETV